MPASATTLADYIKTLRKKACQSQEALAREAGVSTSFVRLVEGGYCPARSDAVERILAVLA